MNDERIRFSLYTFLLKRQNKIDYSDTEYFLKENIMPLLYSKPDSVGLFIYT